ncbi:hypothetical protein CR513_27863, partial [Mucuna pruriens]
MGNWTGGPMMVAIAVALGWLSLVVMGRPRLHKVGGSRGWINHGVNYSQWSAQEHKPDIEIEGKYQRRAVRQINRNTIESTVISI